MQQHVVACLKAMTKNFKIIYFFSLNYCKQSPWKELAIHYLTIKFIQNTHFSQIMFDLMSSKFIFLIKYFVLLLLLWRFFCVIFYFLQTLWTDGRKNEWPHWWISLIWDLIIQEVKLCFVLAYRKKTACQHCFAWYWMICFYFSVSF